MAANRSDISQIRKYLEGELDNAAMHQLERDAFDDPFLMDALDGFAEATPNQQVNLVDLGQRLQQRIGKSKVRRLIPWKYYAAAASILMIFTLGYLLWPPAGKPGKQRVAAVVTTAPADHPPVQTDTLSTGEVAQKKLMDKAAAQPVVAAKTSQPAPAADRSISATAEANEQDSKGMALSSTMADNNVSAKKENGSGYMKAPVDSPMQNQVFAKTMPRENSVLREVAIPGKSSALTEKDLSKNTSITTQTLTGKVDGVNVTTLDRLNLTVMTALGRPLANARIDIDGLKPGAQMRVQTDADGRATVPVNGQGALNVISPGFESAQINPNGNSEIKVALKPADDFLSDPDLMASGKTKTLKPIKQAHPLMGWENYYKYLNAQAISTSGESGTVELSFTVDAKGQRIGFNVIKGLNEQLNQRAIALVKNGPAWAPDASGATKTIKLRLHFSASPLR